MADISPQYLQKYSSEEKVRDFTAGMTDYFFLKQAKLIGFKVPKKKWFPLTSVHERGIHHVLFRRPAPVAQLDRALDFESRCRPFESGRVYQI